MFRLHLLIKPITEDTACKQITYDQLFYEKIKKVEDVHPQQQQQSQSMDVPLKAAVAEKGTNPYQQIFEHKSH